MSETYVSIWKYIDFTRSIPFEILILILKNITLTCRTIAYFYYYNVELENYKI